MKRILASMVVLLATVVAPVRAADPAERNESVPDANPECMERNGPDCVLQSAVVPSRMASPPGVVVITPIAPPATVEPAGTIALPGSINPPGVVGATAPAAPAAPAPATPTAPSAIIAPRR